MREVQSATPRAKLTHTCKLHKKRPGGKCIIENEVPYKDFRQDIQSLKLHDDKEPEIRASVVHLRPFTCPGKVDATSAASSETSIKSKEEVKEWLSQRHIEVLRRQADAETRRTKELFEPIIQAEETFVQDIGNFLRYHDIAKLRRKEVQHKKWDERVNEPLTEQIKKTMATIAYDDIVRRKYLLHRDYLEYVNRKGHVFLDSYSPEEYYPFALDPCKPSQLTAYVPQLRDPLVTPQRQRTREQRVMLDPQVAGLVPLSQKEAADILLPPLQRGSLGRKGTEPSTWKNMHFCQLESPFCKASRVKVRNNLVEGQLDLNSWAEDVDQKIVDDEMGLYSRRKLPMLHLNSKMAAVLREDLPYTPPPTPPPRQETALEIMAI